MSRPPLQSILFDLSGLFQLLQIGAQLRLFGAEFRLELAQLFGLFGERELRVGGGALLRRERVGAADGVGADLVRGGG